MTQSNKNGILTIIFALLLITVGLTAYSASRASTEYRLKEEIALNRIEYADSTIAALRTQVRERDESIDSLRTSISLSTVEKNEALARARQAEIKLVEAEAEIVYAEPDSILAELATDATGHPVELCNDFERFCISRPLVEDVITKYTLVIPALYADLDAWKGAVQVQEVLIGSYAEQVRLQDDQNSSLTAMNLALTTRGDEYEGLYHLADRALSRERLFRRVGTLGLVTAGILVLVLSN
jgi:hypothetical protein